MSVPGLLPADPEAGLEAVPADPLTASLGFSLVVLWVLARIQPHRAWFLISGIWFLVLAAKVTLNIYEGDNFRWGIVVLVLLLGAKGAFELFRRFAPASPEATEEPGAPR